MNWKDHINLFWNGKFRFLHKDNVLPNDSFVSLNLHDEGNPPTDIEISERYSKSDYHRWAEVKDCTLIARKIEDMTDEERQPCLDIMGFDDMTWEEYSADRESFLYTSTATEVAHPEKDIEDFIQNCTEGTIYALSIGVYPFDQNHFETGEVIDIKTL